MVEQNGMWKNSTCWCWIFEINFIETDIESNLIMELIITLRIELQPGSFMVIEVFFFY